MCLPTRTEPVKVTRSVDHGVADVRRIAGDDRQHLRRQARLVERVGQEQRGERRQLGRLQHHAVVGGEGRRQPCATMLSGWLNGVMAEMALSGWRNVKILRGLPCG